VVNTYMHRLALKIVIHCARNLKKDDWILIVFGVNIPDRRGHQMTFIFPPHSVSGSALPGEIRTSEISHFYSRWYDCLIKIAHTKHILSRFLSLWLTVCPIVQLLTVGLNIQNIGPLCETQARKCFPHLLTVSIMFCFFNKVKTVQKRVLLCGCPECEHFCSMIYRVARLSERPAYIGAYKRSG